MESTLNDYKSYEVVETKIETDKLLKLDPDETLVYQKFRAKNATGSLILGDMYFTMSINFDILKAMSYREYMSLMDQKQNSQKPQPDTREATLK